MKARGDVNSKVHIFATMALGRERVVSLIFGRLYSGKAPILILQRLNEP